MSTTVIVKVDRIITEADMRVTRGLWERDYKAFAGLKRGHVALLLNRRQTIARFVDSERTVHTMWADEGEQFDLPTLEDMVQRRTLAIGVRVLRGKGIKPKRDAALSLPPKKKRKTA